jgi:hypothetical protein
MSGLVSHPIEFEGIKKELFSASCLPRDAILLQLRINAQIFTVR